MNRIYGHADGVRPCLRVLATLLGVVLSSTVWGQPATVVVELFTSEGCSSCPRADMPLGELTVDASRSEGEVYGLSFHVDYWDRLGWKDRFSDGAYTQRQYQYAKRLPDSRVYTPQMVVDGRVGFVGSDRVRAVEAIESALARDDELRLSLSVKDLTASRVVIEYDVDGLREGLGLSVAIAQRSASTNVKHGENDGRLLRHRNLSGRSSISPSDRRHPARLDWRFPMMS